MYGNILYFMFSWQILLVMMNICYLGCNAQTPLEPVIVA